MRPFRLKILSRALVIFLGFLWQFSCTPGSMPPRTINLGNDWQFKSINADEWHKAVVPGNLFTDLLNNQLIPDPFINGNEDSVQWVQTQQWEYRTHFSLSKADLAYNNVNLAFDGLDTYADVYLNDVLVLSASNMFREWQLNAKSYMKVGDNELHIVFTPPAAFNRAQLDSLPYQLPAGSESVDTKVSPFTRKAAYQFGWDFAPRLLSMGIWQPVYLNLWQSAKIDDVYFDLVNLSEEKAEYVVEITLESDFEQEIILNLGDLKKKFKLTKGLNSLSIDYVIQNPKLWWPNGWGDPYLYQIPIELLSETAEVYDTFNARLGIRTIELIQEEDTTGKSFYFEVNGEKLFAKGANWSPLSSFAGSIEDSVYINRIKAVKDAHMNMLRVWGGGIYEKDLFYQLCDENGILVWQDFMFANSMYPGDSAFRENVAEEVKQQVTRLRKYPSLALWNGNNEIEVAWNNWGWQKQYGYTERDSSKIWHDYSNLFEHLIPNIIEKYDHFRPYTSTSPLSNWGRPENFNRGSMHYWGVWHGKDTFEDYKLNVGRFMVEYGFQSYPELATLSYYIRGQNLEISNIVNDNHQKSYIGNKLILEQIDKYFDKANDINDFIDKSQLVQALALKMAIEAHRVGKEKCGGTLFWQLNDCWPGPSWSVIDYFGKKKKAYSIVQDRFKPIILVAQQDDNNFNIYGVNDQLQDVQGELKLELIRANGKRSWVSTKSIKLSTNAVKKIYSSDIRKLLDDMPADQVFLKISLMKDDSTILDIENFYFVKPKLYQGELDLLGG